MASNLQLQLRLRATAAGISTLRAELQGWLSELGVSGDEILDLQLACSEALTMVIRDTVALVVDVEGWCRGGIVSVAVRDYGLCRDVTRIDLDQEGVFGIALIQAVVDDLDIRWHADGRTTILSRRLRPSTDFEPLRSQERGCLVIQPVLWSLGIVCSLAICWFIANS